MSKKNPKNSDQNSSDDNNSTEDLTSGINEMRLRSSSNDSVKSVSFDQIACKNGAKCFNNKCQYSHPKGWNACPDGVDCKFYECESNHPYQRKNKCRDGRNCRRRGCHFLHPSQPSEICPNGNNCELWECEKKHSHSRKKKCTFGRICYDTRCESIHPTERNPCDQGAECEKFVCQFDHPKGRPNKCRFENDCTNHFCQDLHPDGWDPRQNSMSNQINPDLKLNSNDNTIEPKNEDNKKLLSIEERSIKRENAKLPILSAKDEFCERLKKERFLIVRAETGSGKSTQLPQYAAEYFGGLVACTQPRVITAISLARRVAKEYDGTSVGNSVGYRVGCASVGKEKNRIPGTDILFMTDAIFVQEYYDNREFRDLKVLIIDEAHERSLNTDVVLGIAKTLLIEKPKDFYVVVASATVDPTKFIEFFEKPDSVILNVPGRIHDVSLEYKPILETHLITDTVTIVKEVYDRHEGHTLVFLPGQREIEDAIQLFNQNAPKNCIALPLYSALSVEEQDRVLLFNEDPNEIRRMIIFSTNVAETSLTIENVRLVIDTGIAKQPRFNHENRFTIMEKIRISRSSADQRKGRAGRTANGHCIRLYKIKDFIRDDIEPEILRISLDKIVLRLIYLRFDPLEFPLIDKPPQNVIQKSFENLKELSCIDDENGITERGELFVKLAYDPYYCAVLVDSYLEDENILQLVITIVAILSAPGSLYLTGGLNDDEKEILKKGIAAGAQVFRSDLFYYVSLYEDWLKRGALNSETQACLVCRKLWKMDSSCRECRATYSKMKLLNNKILNIIENVVNESKETMTNTRWNLNPKSPVDKNQTEIIGQSLYKYFPNQHGILKQSPKKKSIGKMEKTGISADVTDHSIFYYRKSLNAHFVASSLVKLPNNHYLIDKLHTFTMNETKLLNDQEADQNNDQNELDSESDSS